MQQFKTVNWTSPNQCLEMGRAVRIFPKASKANWILDRSVNIPCRNTKFLKAESVKAKPIFHSKFQNFKIYCQRKYWDRRIIDPYWLIHLENSKCWFNPIHMPLGGYIPVLLSITKHKCIFSEKDPTRKIPITYGGKKTPTQINHFVEFSLFCDKY